MLLPSHAQPQSAPRPVSAAFRWHPLDGLRAAAAAGRHGGRPVAITADQLDIARARQARGESVTAIAVNLGVGRSTLYRALQPDDDTTPPVA